MADEQQPKTRNLEKLELNRETVQDLTGEEAEAAKGGILTPTLTGVVCSGDCSVACNPPRLTQYRSQKIDQGCCLNAP
jgi:hypothetical protein